MTFEVFERPPLGRPRSFDHDDAERRFLAGESPRLIAEALGVNAHAVRLMLWKRGHDLAAVHRQTATQRFWAKVDRRGPGECWPWLASHFRTGYGQFNHRLSHRVAYELTVGPIPSGMLVCHHCDNPPCCNPAHLFVGTARDNVLDMHAKGRAAPNHLVNLGRRGEDHPRARLSDGDVSEIRRLYSAGLKQVEIAALFGVGQAHVSRLVRGEMRVA